MRSSRIANQSTRGWGKYKKRSVIFLAYGIFLSLIPQFWWLQTSSLLLCILGGAVPFLLSEMAYGGEFPDQNLELWKIRTMRLFGANISRHDIESLAGTVLRPDKDYMYGSGGTKTCGFVLSVPAFVDDPAGFYQGFLQGILEALPVDTTLKDAVVTKPWETDFLKNYRPALLKKGVSVQKRYIFLTFGPGTGKREELVLLKKFSGHTRMSCREIAGYMEFVASPRVNGSGEETPVWQVSQISDGQLLRSGPGDYVHGAVSLCRLPHVIKDDYSRVFMPAMGITSVITTSYRRRTGFLEEVKKSIKKLDYMFRKTDGSLSRVEKEIAEDVKDQEVLADDAELSMFQSVLLYGKRDQVEEVVLELQNTGSCSTIRKSELPLYLADEGFIKESFSAAMPGSNSYLPQRVQDINSVTEASRYIPIPDSAETTEDEYPLVLRTERNTPFYINHIRGGGGVFQVLLGSTGKGKSALASELVRAHLRLEILKGIKTGVVSLDVGGSMTWIKEDIADLCFDLGAKDDSGEYTPLPIHPLHCCLSGKNTTEEKLLARKFLVKLMQIEKHLAGAEELITSALNRLTAEKTVYSLSNFFEYFREEFETHREKVPLTDEMAQIWNDRLATLKKFCGSENGIYAGIFDPEKPRLQSLSGVVNFYANVNLSDIQHKDLAAAFIQLSFMVGYSLCLKYGSEAPSHEQRSMLYIVDEFHEQSKYIDAREVIDLKDQARKNGFVPMVCIQSLKYLILEGLTKEKREAMYQGIGNIFFYSIDGESDYSHLSVFLQEPVPADGKRVTGKFARVLEITKKIATSSGLPGDKRIYPVGHISGDSKVRCLLVDLEKSWLWEITTHAGGRQVRKAVMEALGCPKARASELLARHWPGAIPEDILPAGIIENLIAGIRRGGN